MPAVYLSPVFNGVTLDSNGNPASGWLLYTYDAGTTTPKATYTSQAGSSAQANPIVLNARGESDNPIWLQSGETKFLLKTAAGVDVRTVDDVSGIGYLSSSSNSYTLTSVAGTNTITGNSGESLSFYTVGSTFLFVPANTNSGAVTLNVDGLGAGAVQLGGSAIGAGTIRAGYPLAVEVTTLTPTFEIVTGEPPGLVLIQTQTANASTSIDFTTGISSSYNEYVIVASKVILSSSASLNLVVSQDGGSTWKTGASDYAWVGFGYRDATAFNSNSTGDTRIRLGLNQNVSNGSGPWSGEIRFYIPSDTTLNKMFKWDASQMPPSGTGGTLMREAGAGMFQLNTSAINGIRLIPSSSPTFTITSGNFSLYGVRK